MKKGKDIIINNQNYTTLEGFIDVPENWVAPSERRLQLPVFIVKSTAKTPAEPIFWLDGGPGYSNILTAKKIASPTSAKLLEQHDLVCVGYRGVDGSTILKSKKISKAMNGLGHKMLSDKSLNNVEVKLKEYQIELQQKGININNYTMLDVIEDFEYVRKTFGYERINLLSNSYGTRLALLYSYKYPEVLKRSVMIGANPPGHFVWYPEKTEQILGIYDSIYKSQNNPEYKGSIKQAMKTAFEKMPKRWSMFKLDADKIKAGTFAALFTKDMAGLVFEAYFRAANKGDYSYLYMTQKFVDMGAGAEAIGEMIAKAISADYEKDVDYRKTLRGENTVLGGNVSMQYWGIASAFKVKIIPEEYRKCRMSSTETLVISGDLDVSTPGDYARDELMPFLQNGEQLILKNMSHADIFNSTMTNPDFLHKYFDAGMVDKSSIATTDSIDFKPKMKFGKVKIFVMGVIM
jgi:pimeloyl-ACP methyl ester carboxylesterase